MERHQIIDAMTGLKLYGMRASFDEIGRQAHVDDQLLHTADGLFGIHHATIQVESASRQQTEAHSDALVCDISEQQIEGNNHIGHNH